MSQHGLHLQERKIKPRQRALMTDVAHKKALGPGAVRPQMNLRICFRVRERRDVDLILGQGMLNAGWHAHTLNAPGKFLVSSPEHDTPRRARAYLVTDQDVTETAARHAASRPQLDEVSARRDPARQRPARRLGRNRRRRGRADARGDIRRQHGRRRGDAVVRPVHGTR